MILRVEFSFTQFKLNSDFVKQCLKVLEIRKGRCILFALFMHEKQICIS